MPARRQHRAVRPAPPRRSGPALAEALAFSAHALERFERRAPGEIVQRNEQALRALIAQQGLVLTGLPAWFHGTVSSRALLVGIAGRFVLPAVPAPVRDGVLPARRWLATTFISRDLGADLAELSGEDLSAHTFLPERVVAEWASRGGRLATRPHAALRADLARIPAGSPALTSLAVSVAGRDELRVALAGGTLVLIRAARHEGHGARLRATGWLPAAGAETDPAAARGS